MRIGSEKIVFTGSFSVGKTTILNLLKEDPDFKDHKFAPEVFRNLAKEGLKLNKESTEITQLLGFNEYLKFFLLNEKFVSDRSLIDVYANDKYLYWQKQSLDYHIFNVHRDLIQYYKYLYNIIFYFPIEFPIVKDSVRETDEEYRKIIDNYIQETLDFSFKDRFITVTGTIEQRLNIIKAHIL